jgi:peptide/nickel transport system permease protein
LLRLLLRRALDLLVVLAIASIFVFGVIRLVPGDPAAVIAGPNAPVETLQAIRTNLGLDQPLPVQYVIWLKGVLHGDLGTSYLAGQSVMGEIAQRFPVTVELAIGGMLVAVLIGVALGLLAGTHQDSPIDGLVSGFNTLWLSVPTFWSGLLFLLVFALLFHALPVGGSVPLTDDPLGSVVHMILPSVTLGLAIAPEIAWFVRNGVLDVMGQDYVRTARAKGLPPALVIRRHVIRNAMLPLLTVIGIQTGKVLGGAVVVESIFSLPGIGGLVLNAIQERDYPTVQGVILFVVVVFVIVNFVTDLAYMWADPRVSVG